MGFESAPSHFVPLDSTQIPSGSRNPQGGKVVAAMAYRSCLTTAACVAAVSSRRSAPWVLAAATVLSLGLTSGRAQQTPFAVTAADADRVPAPFMMTAADDLDSAEMDLAVGATGIKTMMPRGAITAFEISVPPLSERFGERGSQPIQISRTAKAFVVTSGDTGETRVASSEGEGVTAFHLSAGKKARLGSFADTAATRSDEDAGHKLALSNQAIEARLSAAGIETAAMPALEATENQALLLAVFQSRHGLETGPALPFEQLTGRFAAEPMEALDDIEHPVVPVPSPPGLLARLSEMG